MSVTHCNTPLYVSMRATHALTLGHVSQGTQGSDYFSFDLKGVHFLALAHDAGVVLCLDMVDQSGATR
jgi:hypothetical protein